MSKQLLYSNEARLQLKKGIDNLANMVKVTLGPKGRNVILHTEPYNPIISNDGVTIAREIKSDDPVENAGMKLIRESASKTNDSAGDGTTTAVILTQAIIEQGMQALASGQDAVRIKAEIEADTKTMIDAIKKEVITAEDIDSLINIATISCGNPELGKIVADTVFKVGKDGLVTLEDNVMTDTTAEITEGLKVSGGYISPFFVTNRGLQEAIYEDVPIVVTDQSLTTGEEMLRLLQTAKDAGFKSLVVIAGEISGGALAFAIVNHNVFKTLPVRVVGFGEMGEGYLRDIASVTGATFITTKDGRKIKDFTAPEFGKALKVVSNKNDTTILADNLNAEDRIAELEGQLKNAKDYEAESLKERIAKLKSAVGVIKVGGLTDTERIERKLRVEDAINATKAAFNEGVVAGGGSALLRASTKKVGHIMATAVKEPFNQLVKNSSLTLDKSELEEVLTNLNKTINFATGELVNAHLSGIIDPVKVIISALENSASTASLFLTAEGVYSESTDTSERV